VVIVLLVSRDDLFFLLPMKFSALNVDFSSPSPDPLGSRRPVQAGIKDNYPPKKWLFYRNYLV